MIKSISFFRNIVEMCAIVECPECGREHRISNTYDEESVHDMVIECRCGNSFTVNVADEYSNYLHQK